MTSLLAAYIMGEIRRSVCVTRALINGKAAALIERQVDNNIPRAYLLMVFYRGGKGIINSLQAIAH